MYPLNIRARQQVVLLADVEPVVRRLTFGGPRHRSEWSSSLSTASPMPEVETRSSPVPAMSAVR